MTQRSTRRAPVESNKDESVLVSEVHENPEDNKLTQLNSEQAAEMLAVPEITEADLTGPEMSAIKLRSEIVDKAVQKAKDSQDEATYMLRTAQLLQNELTMQIQEIIKAKGLAQEYSYRADLERGKIVKVG